MKIRTLALAFALPIALAALPQAAAADQVSTGSVELSPQVTFSHWNIKRQGYGNVDSFTNLDFAPSIGFCLTDHWEVNGGLLIRYAAANGMSNTALGLSAGLTYNFTTQGRVIPFAGIGFGTLFNDGFTFNDTAVLAPSLRGGLRMLVGNASSVNMSLGYEHESDGQVSTNRMVAGVGVSLFPWRVAGS